MSLQIDYTDTYGGEANYSWVRRYWCAADLTHAQHVRLAKLMTGLTGRPCSKEGCGGMVILRPRGMCRVVFLTHVDPGYECGTEVDAKGNPVEEKAGV